VQHVASVQKVGEVDRNSCVSDPSWTIFAGFSAPRPYSRSCCTEFAEEPQHRVKPSLLDSGAVANQGNRCQVGQGEWARFMALIPGEKVTHRTAVALDRARGAVGLEVGEPRIEEEQDSQGRRLSVPLFSRALFSPHPPSSRDDRMRQNATVGRG